MEVDKKTESFYILGYLLELVIKSGDLKEKFLKIANFARLPSQIHQILQIFAKFSPNIFVHDFFRSKNW
jgi:hypothetical protein